LGGIADVVLASDVDADSSRCTAALRDQLRTVAGSNATTATSPKRCIIRPDPYVAVIATLLRISWLPLRVRLTTELIRVFLRLTIFSVC